MTSKNQKKSTALVSSRNAHGLRLVKCGPDSSVESKIKNVESQIEQKSRPTQNSLVRQLTSLADSLDAEVEAILRM